MVEHHSFVRGNNEAESAYSNQPKEGFLTLDKLSLVDGITNNDLLHRAVETSENFHKIVQEAFDLIHPLVARINALSPELRKQIVTSIPDDLGGYAYDAVREHCKYT
jgi:hypothetical protein